MSAGANGTGFMEKEWYDSRERRVVPGKRNGIRSLAPVLPKQLGSTPAHIGWWCRVWLRLTLTARLRSLNFVEFWYKE